MLLYKKIVLSGLNLKGIEIECMGGVCVCVVFKLDSAIHFQRKKMTAQVISF